MIILDKDTHTYYVDGKEANTSVTRMLHEQGLAPDYSGVSRIERKSGARPELPRRD